VFESEGYSGGEMEERIESFMKHDLDADGKVSNKEKPKPNVLDNIQRIV
jgi:hypothetical protein